MSQPKPEKPEIEVRILTEGDEAVLLSAHEGVFDHDPDTKLTAEFLADRRHHIAVALAGERVVGFVSAFDHVHPDKPAELWIMEVGVAEAFRRQGIATLLMMVMLEHGRMLGCAEAWVATERVNDPAIALYRALGGKEEPEAAILSFSLA